MRKKGRAPLSKSANPSIAADESDADARRKVTLSEETEMPSFDSAGVTIHYLDRGHGNPVILVHGFASNADHNWGVTGWIDLLARDYRVLALDCRGHGRSDKPHDTAAYSSTIMEDDVIRMMDAAGVGRALLMGYSMGGRIALGLLVRYPNRFRAVVLGGIGDGMSVNDPARRRAIVEALLAGDPSAISDQTPRLFRQFAQSLGNDLTALAACMGAERSPVDIRALAQNTVPVMIVVGTKDAMVGDARSAAARIRGSRFVEIEGRDHLNTPGDRRFKEAVLEFFRNAPE
jgi:pimeloyl-ACP methyl ester carboxylesterase